MADSITSAVDRLRSVCARLFPVLAKAGWDKAQIEEINALVRQHRDAQDLQALTAVLAWAETKHWELMERAQAAWAADQARLVFVRPHPVTGIATAYDHAGREVDATHPLAAAPGAGPSPPRQMRTGGAAVFR